MRRKVCAPLSSLLTTWRLLVRVPSSVVPAGKPVACGQMIRLEHISTKKNLHSHLFESPLTHGQEVSAFGAEGNGDTGDNWILECAEGGDVWARNQDIRLRHADTGLYIRASSSDSFNHRNCHNWYVASSNAPPPLPWLPCPVTHHPVHTHTARAVAQPHHGPIGSFVCPSSDSVHHALVC